VVRAAVALFLGLLLGGCGIWRPLPDGGLGDGGQDGGEDVSAEASAAAWLATCHQYYGQPGLGSAPCTSCTNQSCGAEEAAAQGSCSGDSDTQCILGCGQEPPYPPSYCTCLETCLSASCMAARTPDETCELAACGSMCN
jgi:hypothetical protein